MRLPLRVTPITPGRSGIANVETSPTQRLLVDAPAYLYQRARSARLDRDPRDAGRLQGDHADRIVLADRLQALLGYHVALTVEALDLRLAADQEVDPDERHVFGRLGEHLGLQR